MLVVDASAVVELVLGTARADEVQVRLRQEARLVAPDLIGLEVQSALWRLVRAGELPSDAAESAARTARASAIHRLPLGPVDDAAWELRDRLRLADAYYAAYARLFNSPLLTCDARLTRAAVPGLSVLLVQ